MLFAGSAFAIRKQRLAAAYARGRARVEEKAAAIQEALSRKRRSATQGRSSAAFGELLLPGASLDERLLAAMEAREDAEGGWDRRNHETFDDACSVGGIWEDQGGEGEEKDQKDAGDDDEEGEERASEEDTDEAVAAGPDEGQWLSFVTCTKMLDTRRKQRAWLGEETARVQSQEDAWFARLVASEGCVFVRRQVRRKMRKMPPRKGAWRRSWRKLPVAELGETTRVERRSQWDAGAPVCAPCGGVSVPGVGEEVPWADMVESPAGPGEEAVESTSVGSSADVDPSVPGVDVAAGMTGQVVEEDPWRSMSEHPAGPSQQDYAEALRQAQAHAFVRMVDGYGECFACTLYEKGKRSRWGRPGEHFATSAHQKSEAWVARKCAAGAEGPE